LEKTILASAPLVRQNLNSYMVRRRYRSQRALTSAEIGDGKIPESETVSKPIVVGWVIELVGTVIWIYGYLTTGHPSIINWHANTPWWIADYLPNMESEIGMVLVFVGLVPIYWPPRR